MIVIKRGSEAENINNASKHTLFVEGKDSNSVDPKLLNILFGNKINIKVLGASFSVKSVAEALYPHHSWYYFLIDRDYHHDDASVQKSWDNFPNPDTHNLLIWKKREIENYFLDPEYLFYSTYLEVSKEKLEKKIIEFSKARLFLDVANYVIISIREELKHHWIKKFSNPDEFTNKEDALEKLKNTKEFWQHATNTSQKVASDALEAKFYQYHDLMTGGQDDISFENGLWLNMVQGKKVLSQVIHSECFRVKAMDGTLLHGREKLRAVVTELLKKDASILPADFNELKRLILARLNTAIGSD